MLQFETDVVLFVLFCRSFTEPMSVTVLEWSQGCWKAYAKDLETALQSEDARACKQ